MCSQEEIEAAFHRYGPQIVERIIREGESLDRQLSGAVPARKKRGRKSRYEASLGGKKT